jgi:hypothetical protein
MQITFAAIDQFPAQNALVDPAVSAQNLSSTYQCPDRQMYRARIQFLFSLNQWAFEETSWGTLIDIVRFFLLLITTSLIRRRSSS